MKTGVSGLSNILEPIVMSQKMANLPPYPFAEIDALRDRRVAEGADVIDFGVGDPVDPVPFNVVAKTIEGLIQHRTSGYPSYVGNKEFRVGAAAWLKRRFGVTLDPETEITSAVGSKEAIFHVAGAFVDPGDFVAVPSPGYPPYTAGAKWADAEVIYYPVRSSGPILPDLTELAEQCGDRLRMVWVTQPHVPTGRIAQADEIKVFMQQAHERNILVCSDEAYCELWMEAPPTSFLEASETHVLAFHSLSKQSSMTGYRVGFVSGNASATLAFRRLKMTIDSGVPQFIQQGALAALLDDGPAEKARENYRIKAELLVDALRDVGCSVDFPEAGFYLWAKAPGGSTGIEFSRRLLEEEPALVTMPGEWLADPLPGRDTHPGSSRVRFALVPSNDRCQEAAMRIRKWKA